MKYILFFVLMFGFNVNAKTLIVFVNGASNSSAKELSRNTQIVYNTLLKNLVFTHPTENIEFAKYFVEGSIVDPAEVTLQQTFSNSALKKSINTKDYYKILGKIYSDFFLSQASADDVRNVSEQTKELSERLKKRLLDGYKVVFLSHSQGNLFVEAAIAHLYYLNEVSAHLEANVKVVSIGSVAATSWNGSHFNIDVDETVYGGGYRVKGDAFKPMDGESVCLSDCSKKATAGDLNYEFAITNNLSATSSIISNATHGIANAYMNESIRIYPTRETLPSHISYLLRSAINELSAIKFSISPTIAEISKDITFTITGQNLTSEMGFAVDDCTPSSNELPDGTTTQRQFRCTINGIPGDKNLYLKDKPGGKILFTTKISATTNTSAKWLSTITPPDYVVKQFIYKDLSSIQNGNFTATGEYKINKDSIGCNLSQSLAVSGTRSNDNFNIRLEYNSDQTNCPDGTHTAGKGYVETYTGVMNSGVLFVTPQTACSFMLGGTTCYNFASFSPIQ